MHFGGKMKIYVKFFILNLIVCFKYFNINSYDLSFKLQEKNENFIRDIIQELGMSQDIKVFKMSSEEIKKYGRNNAFVTDKKEMYISEDFFNELNNEEKRFLVGHELMHLKLEHAQKRNLQLFMSSLVLYFVGHFSEYYIKKNYGDRYFNGKIRSKKEIYIHNLKSGLISLASGLGFGAISTSILLFFNRKRELEADRESVLKLKCFDGGINFFKKMKKEIESSFSESPTIYKFLFSITSTHPDHKTRIKQIKNLKKEYNNSDLSC